MFITIVFLFRIWDKIIGGSCKILVFVADVADTKEAYTEYEEAFGCRAISLAGINTALPLHY